MKRVWGILILMLLWLLIHKVDNLTKATHVIATVYHPTGKKCADGSIADPSKRIVAVSRDLHRRYGGVLEFGDKIQVRGANQHDGVWEVHDLMSGKWEKRIDFLVLPGNMGKWEVEIENGG